MGGPPQRGHTGYAVAPDGMQRHAPAGAARLIAVRSHPLMCAARKLPDRARDRRGHHPYAWRDSWLARANIPYPAW